MNISAASLANASTLFSSCQVNGGAMKQVSEKKVRSEMTGEERLIDNFKEEHSPAKEKANQIYYKFIGGKELSTDELSFLAKNEPELYKEVREVMLERQAMEMRLKTAKTKMEVASVHMNEISKIKDGMGNGEKATKKMARVTQTDSAFQEFTASVEYRELEDVKTQTEDQCKKLQELKQEMEDWTEQEGKSENVPFEETDNTGENQEGTIENTGGDDVDGKKQEHILMSGKKRKKQPQEDLFAAVQVDAGDIRKKMRELYHGLGGVESSKKKEFDVSL